MTPRVPRVPRVRRGPRARGRGALVAATTLALLLTSLGTTTARAADTPPAPPTPTTVSAAMLPTWQINGVAWSQAIVGNTVYVTGSFTKARPPGVAVGGPGEVPANNLFAYDLTTGNRVAGFDHSLDAQGLVVTASPDGSRVYVGGDFTSVDGVPRGHVAAFNTADGSLVTSFAPNVGGQVRAFGVTASTVYVGGNFPSANGVPRASLAAFAVSNGAISPWAPTAEGEGGYVWTMTMSPDGSRVIAGGSFSTLNGVAAYGMGAVDAASGATLPWAAQERIRAAGLNGAITSLKTDGTQVYGSGYAFGSGATFEGTFAADPTTGAINWVNDCLGDTYDTYVLDQALYSVSHSHNCSAIDQFPDTSPRARWQKATAAPIRPTGTITQTDAYGWDYRGLPYAGLLQWYPDLEFGSYTPSRQAAWSVTGSGRYVTLAGEFPTVNGTAQQGLVRFAYRGVAGPSQKPIYNAAMNPTATSRESGTVRLTWTSTWDRDDANLTYDVFRDGGGTPVATRSQSSVFWNLGAMGFTDTGLPPGSSHTYKVRAKDSDGNVQWSLASAPVTVSSAAGSAYTGAVRADGASHLWKLGDTGPGIVDAVGYLDGTSASATFGAAGALAGDGSMSSAGGSNPRAYSSTAESHPAAATVEAWVNTTSTSGGRILGFGDSMAGTSSTTKNDMVLYLTSAGKLSFALQSGSWRAVTSARAINDGQWHHVAATADDAGVSLYVDGRRVGRDQTPVTMASFLGYWRILADQTSGLPQRPTSAALSGAVDEVAVYPTGLSQAQVQSHYTASGRPPTWAAPPTDAYGAAVVATKPDLFWRLGETSGVLAADSSSSGADGTVTGGVAWGTPGVVSGATAATFNGKNGLVVDKESWNAPATYSSELWFSSTSRTGGKLIGFGNASSGLSSSYDRQVVLLANGRLQFGANPGARAVAETTGAYNDGQWHHVVATQGADGMKLYVDGVLRATNAATGAQGYTGFWRVGGDSTWGGTTTSYVAGAIDEVAVYPTVLPQSAVEAHYAASGRQLANKVPTASFTHTESFLTASVDGSSSSDPDGTIASYAWVFGDGTTGSGVTANHAYAAAGTYQVTLTVTDDRGGTATTTQPLTVVANQPPKAAFTSVTSFLGVTLDASTSTDPEGSLASYAWAFGDGSTGSGPTASHTYPAPGTYPVTLTVTDGAGATATSTQSVAVVANQAPTATFTHTESLRSVTLDASGSSDPDGSVASYGWDFGDGSSGSGATATHSYAADGTYAVTLTVTDAQGARTSASQQVSVTGPVNQPPTASFTHRETFLSVAVDGSASSDPDGTVGSYAWSFGDGSTGTGATTTHAYANPGTYSVTLTVTDDGGRAATSTAQVTVAGNPVYAQDAFGRTVTGGWGPADVGGAWTVSGTTSRYAVSNGSGRVTLAVGGSATTGLAGVAKTDTEVATVVTTDKAPTGGGLYASVIGRQVSAGNDYRAKLRMLAGGAVSLSLARTEAGVETVLSSVTVPGLVYSPGDRLQVRLQVTGTSPTTVRAKVWKDGAPEPSGAGAWTLTGADSSAPLQNAGSIGFYSYVSASATSGSVAFDYDDVWVGPVRP